ncbi:MAG: response regulator [Geobacteraceae bacterium]|nr:response regulator [Geobacteraceae bacterium]
MFAKKIPRQNPVTLRFLDHELEKAFRTDYHEKSLSHLRLDLMVGLFLYALFGIHDYWVIPDIKEFAWMLRFLLVCPILFGVLVLTYSPFFGKVAHLSIFLAGFVAGAGVVLMIIKASPPGNYMSYAGLLLILLFYFRQRFVTASALTWSIFLLYEAVALWDAKIPSQVLFSNTFILSTFSLTGMYMSYTLEQHVRSGFLLRRTIQERNDEIAKTNLVLKRKVAERRQAETAVQDQMRFLRTLLDTIPNPIFYTDVKGRYAGCNRAYEIFFGQTKDELTGQSAIDLYIADIVHTTDTSEKQADLQNGVRTNEAVLRHSDGTNRTVLFSRASYADVEGKPAGMVGVVPDITELKKAEEEKLRLETQLFQSQKIEALGQLAGGIAHEFNNILTAIIGYVHLMRKHVDEGDTLRFYVDNTISCSERAARLIRDILAFGRKQKIDPRLVNLNEVVGKTESILAMMTGEDIELKLSLNDAPLWVMADGGLIGQALMNLAANSRDAMPTGGRLSISTSLITMEREFLHAHGVAQPGTYGMICVRDSGIGMDPKTRERMFEPFFTTKEVGKGTGLGLSIVYGIIKQHNGCIDADSEFSKGTTFRIYLPIVPVHENLSGADTLHPSHPFESPAHSLDAAGSPACEEPFPSGTETVLVAEDNDTVRILTKNLLLENGYTVIEANHGEEAIRKFMEHADAIRLLLLDVIMPRKNGWEVYDTIRKIRPETRVIFMSGYTADVFAHRLIPEEGMNLMNKPIPPGDLLRAVRQELDRELPAEGNGHASLSG